MKILFKAKKIMAAFVVLTAVLSISPFNAFAEGQRIVKLEKSENVKPESQEKKGNDITPQLAGKVKQQVIAKRFKRANSRLEDYAAEKFSEYVMDASGNFGIDPFLIASILIKESTVKYKARSRCGAYGLMQVNWSVHGGNIKKAFSQINSLPDLIQPRNNIMVGTYIFSCYLDSAEGDVSKALSSYLGSSGNRYIARVMKYHGQMVDSYSSMMKAMLKDGSLQRESA